ncbi:Spore coat associated protein JA (CotJA) [Natronincola peptidivorans]|uniref:Spore coat associated protein JA (CotJA) n=1 Tax=Natronincola peptidivorans TaxID=426128 RepID=A0A1I0DM06_9FIRM|nr:spore coat associated protein CotJA [Natronincola peptidivorans]SET33235.1 Spore coat associated protein JA (CotJA) [Natronincola peptidivorans]
MMYTPYPGIYPIPFMPMYVKYAHAYVPYQTYMEAFPLTEAMMKGTLFPELYQPYIEEDRRWEGK